MDLDATTLKQMFKGSLPSTIAIAMYQAKDVSDVYETLGYLVAIVAMLGLSVMPRGKFMQTMWVPNYLWRDKPGH